MASRYEELEHRLAAAAAVVDPGLLFEWQQVSHSLGDFPMRAGFRTVGGARIRYAASEGPAERTVLLTSPWPESLYAFAPIWPGYGAGHFVWEEAPDAFAQLLGEWIDEHH